ncbi:MAG TPA: antibiotic biosynthesis monooxygenase [Spongiibacteraceae bacterium]|nr:antibiotic biosynthesis monooxygenase [Spongiibacteraceae bacterium]
MILEVAILQIRSGLEAEFESAFEKAQSIISSMPGYLGHELQRCLEVGGKYILLVRWQSVKDHEVGFRQSPQYQDWKQLLHHFYNPFPVVEHFERIHPKKP